MAGSYIESIEPGSKAESVGLKAGERVVATNGDSFKMAELLRLESGTGPYTLTVASPSRMVTFTMKVIGCLTVPAALAGGLLTFGMIPFYRSHQHIGFEWEEDLLSRCLASRPAIISVGAFGCAMALRTILQRDVLHAVFWVSRVIYCFGLLHCFVDGLASPLLASQLPDAVVARWRSENKWMWLAIAVALSLRVLRVAAFYRYLAPEGFKTTNCGLKSLSTLLRQS